MAYSKLLMAFRFEKLEVWKLARAYAAYVYKLSSKFPKEEVFGLQSQIRRAVTSIALNIAEGSNRGSDADFSRFLRFAVASLEEVVTSLYIALDLNYITNEDFKIAYNKANELGAKLGSFSKVVKPLGDKR